MLEGFADYGFPESHAASFALLAYASAYVKCHLPAVFAAAILNVQPMGFYSTEVLVNDARRHGVKIEPIAVNASEYWSRVECGEPCGSVFISCAALGKFSESAWKRRSRRVLSRTCWPSHSARGSNAKRSRTWRSPEFLHRGTRRDARRCGRCADSTNAKRAASSGALMDVDEPAVEFEPPAPKQLVAFDLWSTGVTPSGQVMEHFRADLAAQNVIPAAS